MVPPSIPMNGFQMLSMHDWNDFYHTYFWQCVIAVVVTWVLVHYVLKWYFEQQKKEREQVERMKDLPGIYAKSIASKTRTMEERINGTFLLVFLAGLFTCMIGPQLMIFIDVDNYIFSYVFCALLFLVIVVFATTELTRDI